MYLRNAYLGEHKLKRGSLSKNAGIPSALAQCLGLVLAWCKCAHLISLCPYKSSRCWLSCSSLCVCAHAPHMPHANRIDLPYTTTPLYYESQRLPASLMHRRCKCLAPRCCWAVTWHCQGDGCMSGWHIPSSDQGRRPVVDVTCNWPELNTAQAPRSS